VEDYLLLNGMASTYDRWIHHGEPLHSEPDAQANHGDDGHGHHGDDGIEFMEKVLQENSGLEEEDGYEDDRIPDLLKDLYDSEDRVDESKSMFAEVLEDAKHAAHDGGKFSRFSFIVKLLHIKSYYRISNAAFNAILHLLNLQYPNSSVPKHYDEALSIIQKLGLGYVSIHVCPNNCVLFRKDFAKHKNCQDAMPLGGRMVMEKRQIPEKVLWHFPLIPRLQRMFLLKKSSEEVHWHKLKRQPWRMNSAIQPMEKHGKTLMRNMKILRLMLGTSDLA
jgi:hypothetical protein